MLTHQSIIMLVPTKAISVRPSYHIWEWHQNSPLSCGLFPTPSLHDGHNQSTGVPRFHHHIILPSYFLPAVQYRMRSAQVVGYQHDWYWGSVNVRELVELATMDKGRRVREWGYFAYSGCGEAFGLRGLQSSSTLVRSIGTEREGRGPGKLH